MSANTITYLDYNASAPARAGVAEAMHLATEEGGNPSSVHQTGRRARAQVEAAREKLARMIGVKPEEVVFTSGATEANNLALEGLKRAGAADRVLISASEHEAVQAATQDLGLPWDAVTVTSDGLLDLEHLKTLLEKAKAADEKVVVAVMLANNQTGVIHPVADAAKLVHEYGGLLLCDAVQALGKIPVDRDELNADLLAFSAHKIGGPTGVGALILREGLALRALNRGGGQELGRRSGTENVTGIVGFGAALDAVSQDGDLMARLEAWRDALEKTLLNIDPETVIYGKNAPRLPNTSNFAVPGLPAETALMALDLAGFEVSSGSACSSGKVTPSHVLKAMGASDEMTGMAIRVSLGWGTKEADTVDFTRAWAAHHQRMATRVMKEGVA
jgi:cysteine desulfurase